MEVAQRGGRVAERVGSGGGGEWLRGWEVVEGGGGGGEGNG